MPDFITEFYQPNNIRSFSVFDRRERKIDRIVKANVIKLLPQSLRSFELEGYLLDTKAIQALPQRLDALCIETCRKMVQVEDLQYLPASLRHLKIGPIRPPESFTLGCTNLQILELVRTDLSQPSVCPQLSSLTTLSLQEVTISSQTLGALEWITPKLQELFLSLGNNYASSILGLGNLTTLKKLALEDFHIRELAVPTSLTELDFCSFYTIVSVDLTRYNIKPDSWSA
eukprot:TRINITY_DN11991_c0_g1_i1.p1 TRINITY_DN11991_c0_g1~~TRINITY_DN11991_c0_g1_i1.p1  ORF type:complete len:229 (-),score=31.81 TRINITY_DN11991_c0_g1_i1:224-910(-)